MKNKIHIQIQNFIAALRSFFSRLSWFPAAKKAPAQVPDESEPGERRINKRAVIRILIQTLKILVALAAAVNLVALFVYRYQIPSWLRRHESAAFEPTVESAGPLAGQTEDIYLAIPVVPVNYSGEADMDALVMDGVYLTGADGQPVDDADIRYEILPGDSRQSKVIQYTTELDTGETLTEERTMNLTARYTGPTITLLGLLPDIDPADADIYSARLGEKGIIRADDGFGNDVTEQVSAVFDGLSDENPDAEMTLMLENQVHDTYEMHLTVNVDDYTGVVLTLTEYRITLHEGDDFDPDDYIDYAHDTEGNDITDSVVSDSDVDTDYPGEYEVWYWAEDSAGTYSPTKKLYVTVEASPEEAGETEDAP